MSLGAQAATVTTQTAVAVGVGTSAATSAMNTSSPTTVWAICNQLQLLILFLLVDTYIPDDVKGLIEGQDFALFNFDFIPAADIPYINIPTEWMDFEQTDINLEKVGVNSRSTFTNIFSLLLTIIFLIVTHITVKLLPKCRKKEETPKGKIQKFWLWLRTKLLDWFMYVIYVRMILEANQVLLFSSLKEIDIFDVEETASIVSLCVAMLVLLMCLFLLIQALYLFCKHFKSYDPEEKFVFMEFYADVKNKRWARLYTALLLARRFLFVIAIIFLAVAGTQWIFGVLLGTQIVYWVALVVLRPFEEAKNNLVEITNETFYFVFIVLMLFLTSEEKWTESMTKLFLGLMTANTLIVTLISFGKCAKFITPIVCFIIAVVSTCAKKFKKKVELVLLYKSFGLLSSVS